MQDKELFINDNQNFLKLHSYKITKIAEKYGVNFNDVWPIGNSNIIEKNDYGDYSSLYDSLHEDEVHLKEREIQVKKINKELNINFRKVVESIFEHECAFCKKKVKLTLDHFFIPWSKKTDYVIKYDNKIYSNCIALCSSCNSSKNKLPPLHYIFKKFKNFDLLEDILDKNTKLTCDLRSMYNCEIESEDLLDLILNDDEDKARSLLRMIVGLNSYYNEYNITNFGFSLEIEKPNYDKYDEIHNLTYDMYIKSSKYRIKCDYSYVIQSEDGSYPLHETDIICGEYCEDPYSAIDSFWKTLNN